MPSKPTSPTPKSNLWALAKSWVEQGKLEKAEQRGNAYTPQEKDIGKPNDKNDSLVGHKTKLGQLVWAHKQKITDNHIKAIRGAFPHAGLNKENNHKLAKLIQHVWKDPDHGVMVSGTTKGHEGDFNELRIRHLSHALTGKDGYGISSDEHGVKIHADRHSTNPKNAGQSTSWHWDGKTLKSFQNDPISGIVKQGSYSYEQPNKNPRKPDRLGKSRVESDIPQYDRGGLGRARVAGELGSRCEPGSESARFDAFLVELLGRAEGSRDGLRKSTPHEGLAGPFADGITDRLAKSESNRVATVAVFKHGKMLFGRRNDNGKWTCPGGHLNPGEKPLYGAIRELWEESGIETGEGKDCLTFLGSGEVETRKGRKTIYCYRRDMGTVRCSPTAKNDPDDEMGEWKWVDVSNGLPADIANNLHSPKNILLQKLGLQDEEGKLMKSKFSNMLKPKVTEPLAKGRKAMAVGTVTTRGGKKFKKEANGEWSPVKEAESSAPAATPEAPVQEKAPEVQPTPVYTTNDDLNKNAANISPAEYVKQSIKINKYRDSPKNRKILASRHKKLLLEAVDGGAELSQEGKAALGSLPSQLKTPAQEKTNLFQSIDLSKVPKKRHEELFKMLNGANSIIESMGLTFKRSLRFEAGNSLKEGDRKSTRATYVGGGSLDRRIVLKDITKAETSLMHEIGHGLDYAMAESDNPNTTRSDEMFKSKTELGLKYQSLKALVVNSDRYLTAEGKHKRYLNKPTEVFARAFEVYSLGKAQALIESGKLDKSFIDRYMPDIFVDSSERRKLDASIKDFMDKQDGETFAEKRAKALNSPEFGKLLGQRLEIQKQGAILSPEKQQKCIQEITELMDFILKNENLRKSSDFRKIKKEKLMKSKFANMLKPKVKDSLAKGKNGDWEKEGYRITMDGDNDDLRVHAFDRSGNKVGESLIDHNPHGIHAATTEIHPDHQRKGLASAMYSLAEKHTGKKMVPSDQIPEEDKDGVVGKLSPQGKAFWSNPNRKFGKSQSLKKDDYSSMAASVKNAFGGGGSKPSTPPPPPPPPSPDSGSGSLASMVTGSVNRMLGKSEDPKIAAIKAKHADKKEPSNAQLAQKMKDKYSGYMRKSEQKLFKARMDASLIAGGKTGTVALSKAEKDKK